MLIWERRVCGSLLAFTGRKTNERISWRIWYSLQNWAVLSLQKGLHAAPLGRRHLRQLCKSHGPICTILQSSILEQFFLTLIINFYFRKNSFLWPFISNISTLYPKLQNPKINSDAFEPLQYIWLWKHVFTFLLPVDFSFFSSYHANDESHFEIYLDLNCLFSNF